jgi:hypothetical protein
LSAAGTRGVVKSTRSASSSISLPMRVSDTCTFSARVPAPCHLRRLRFVKSHEGNALFKGATVVLFIELAYSHDIPVQDRHVRARIGFFHEDGVFQPHDAAEPAAVRPFLTSRPDATDHDHPIEGIIPAASTLEIKLGHHILEPTVSKGIFGFVHLRTDRDDDRAHVQIPHLALFLDRGLEVPHKALDRLELRSEMNLNVRVLEDGIDQRIEELRRRLMGGENPVDKPEQSAQFRLFFHQLHPVTLVGQHQGGRESGDSAAQDQGRPATRRWTDLPGL